MKTFRSVSTCVPLLCLSTLFVGFAQNGPITVSPSQLTFNTSINGTAGSQNLVVVSNNGSAAGFTATTFPSGTWLSVTPSSSTTPQVLSVSVSAGSMAAGAYAGFITITSGSSSSTVPVVLNVNSSGSSPIVATPASVSLNFEMGSTVPQSQQVSVSSSGTSNLTFTATTSTNNNGNWLSVNPSSGTTPTSVTISVNPSNLTAGAYSGAVAINSPGETGILIPVQVNIASPSTIDVTPAQVNFAYQLNTTAPAAQTLNVTAAGGGTISFTATPSYSSSSSCGDNWLVVSPQSSATPSAISVQINTSALPAGECTGSINISAPGASNPTQSIPVDLLVSTNPLLQLPTAGPTFNYQLGTGTPASQTVQVTSSSTALPFTVAATPVSNGPAFLTVTPSSGTTPEALTLAINPTILAGLAPNTYAENVTVSSTGAGNPAQTFTVTLVVSNNPALTASQSAVTFNYQIGHASPTSQTVTLTSTGAPLSYNVTTSTTSCSGFLTATSASGITPVQPGQTSQAVIGVNTNGLTSPQTCNGTVTITAPGSTGSPLTIPVTLNVSSTPLLNASPAVINVVAVTGSITTTTEQISLVSTDGTTPLQFTSTAVTSPAGLTWLSVTPNTGSTPSSLNVGVNAANLPPGIYKGSINITSTSSNVPSQTIPVTLTVGSGSVTVAPTSLAFSQPLGGVVPSSQTITVTGVPVGATAGAVATMLNGAGWLTVSTSGATITVSSDGNSLAQGTYSGVVTIFAPGAVNNPIYVPVTFTVGGAPIFTLTPASVNFTYQVNSILPPAQTIQVSSINGSVPFSAVAVAAPGTASNGIVFVTVTPSSGNTPGNISISLIQAVVQTLAAGTYTNTINLTSSAAGAIQPLTVMLTVTSAGPPTITAITSAADFLATSVSPGELVTIFGTNIGPATPAGLQLTSSGTVATTVSNTSVTFNGVAAPLFYVSANQINAVVPYEVATLSNATVAVMNNSTTSATFEVNITPTAPAIFSEGSNGSGQGAILNQNSSVNSAQNPAAPGSVIAIYATGEGQTIPAGVTGAVTPSTGTSFPKPVLPVTVTIGNQPATVLYAGEAPGLVSGVLQVNAMIPAGLGAGNQPVVLSIGGVMSPNVITVAVQ